LYDFDERGHDVRRVSTLVRAVRRFLKQHALPLHGVIAVSGGPDSVALLRALVSLRRDDGLLVIAHLNHQLRGAESDADEEFVRELHRQLLAGGQRNIEVVCDRADVKALAHEAGDNLESVARGYRYDWLTGVARRFGLPWVATGHTANDQAETVLHRILRGAGLKGLRGIAARRPLAEGIELIRPLLSVSRADVMAYLEELRQPYREDRSNVDVTLTRNRIRLELLPMLAERFNPAIVEVLRRLALQADELYRMQEDAARRLLSEAEKPRAGPRLVFDRVSLAAAPRPVVREMLRLVWDREGWATDAMDFAQWDRLADLAQSPARSLHLPNGVRALARERVVQIGRNPSGDDAAPRVT
jgi:tRNA(Ile)-lysidine synthase